MKKKKHSFVIGGVLFELDAKYAPLKPLGEGSYGVVCSCLNLETGEAVAVKRIGDALGHPVAALRTLREMQILRYIRHPNVILLNDASICGNHVYLVYEQMDTSLHRLISEQPPFSDDLCRYLMFQLLSGLNHLHLSNIIHRDLKPENILVNANLDLKICDFGLSRTKCNPSQPMTEYVATRWYRPPELLTGNNSNYGKEVDMWSAGCILAEMLGRKPIFMGSDPLDQLGKIIDVLGTQTDLSFIGCERSRKYVASMKSSGMNFKIKYPEADPLAVDLLKMMLSFDPRKRISAKEALWHPYFMSLRGPELYYPNPMPLYLSIDEEDDREEDEEKLRTMMHDEVLFYQLV